MRRQVLLFRGPRDVVVAAEPLADPGPGEVLVGGRLSAISGGTELLFYRGQVPSGMHADATLESLGDGGYPLRYGYAHVGVVERLGDGVDAGWQGRAVFTFQPHASHFVAPVDSLLPLPEGMSPDKAALLPNCETGVSLVMDGAPVIGERVVVLGLGIVGQLTLRLLAAFPLAALLGVDGVAARRALAAPQATAPPAADAIRAALGATAPEAGADLVYELSGNPAALDLALAVVGHHGRIVVGSWYGTKRASVDLGGRFHRGHITIQSSQVSHLAARWRGRWSKARRLAVTWTALQQLDAAGLITHRFPLERAADAYALLDSRPQEALQILLTY